MHTCLYECTLYDHLHERYMYVCAYHSRPYVYVCILHAYYRRHCIPIRMRVSYLASSCSRTMHTCYHTSIISSSYLCYIILHCIVAIIVDDDNIVHLSNYIIFSDLISSIAIVIPLDSSFTIYLISHHLSKELSFYLFSNFFSCYHSRRSRTLSDYIR